MSEGGERPGPSPDSEDAWADRRDAEVCDRRIEPHPNGCRAYTLDEVDRMFDAPRTFKYVPPNPRGMRFLVFTDLHGKASVIDKINEMAKRHGAEFVVCLGDVTDMGTGEEAAGILERIDSQVYAVPGNCDPLDFPEKIAGAAVDMHGNAAVIGGRRFVGLGGSNITIFGTPFELEEDDIYDALEGVSEEGMVLMTHAPSYGILDQIPSGQSVGSPAIREIADRYRPILAMSGHIHEAIGVVERDGTVFVNPGPAKDDRMAVVDIDDAGKVSVELIGPADH